ncbi:MAG: imidazoleglycerol-phosphate dehydratase HisB [Victivallales bacterium]|nr:imidazoleglycerol-phosphate dehydratase HisB [Victivallales bacterium]
MSDRTASVSRKTKETDISVKINIDGSGKSKISCGIPFIEHMLELFARHGLFDLEIRASGDIQVDCHHTVEDMGIVMGEAISKALGDKKGICRYGWAVVPMDDSLVLVSLDLSGRPFLVYDLLPPSSHIKDMDTRLFHEFFQALSVKAGMNIHVQKLKGEETHHTFEALFKAFAKALDQATRVDPRVQCIPSTKGIL